VIVAIPGQGHNIKTNTPVMIRGKGFKDVPGVKYKVIRGKLGVSIAETFRRVRARSKYNLKRDSQSVY
jgi:small subunit ribosomal protein S12